MAHPDHHNGLLDWPIYGARDPEIAELAHQLAYAGGLRLSEIEDLIKHALRQRLAVVEVSRTSTVEPTRT
ncbi:hypothetical protein [Aureimonas psammosilenae]|uniref:hypothetical protein n=1 Tax=Aureimonas psammosilenae TaxID=2495496 RepID=UPI0012611180|nr:hypothetical protein [Aureimonas psammosilenae]